MTLQNAHPFRASHDPDLQTRLDQTNDALASSWASLRESSDALIRAKRDNDYQRQKLAELRRAISALG